MEFQAVCLRYLGRCHRTMSKEPRYICPRDYKTRTPAFVRKYDDGGFVCCCVIPPSQAPKDWCPGDVIVQCERPDKKHECESRYITPDEAASLARALLAAVEKWMYNSRIEDIIRDKKLFRKVLYQPRRKK
jgi:hypothetical protein